MVDSESDIILFGFVQIVGGQLDFVHLTAVLQLQSQWSRRIESGLGAELRLSGIFASQLPVIPSVVDFRQNDIAAMACFFCKIKRLEHVLKT